MTITAVTLNGTATSLTDAAMDGFRGSLRGELILSGNPAMRPRDRSGTATSTGVQP